MPFEGGNDNYVSMPHRRLLYDGQYSQNLFYHNNVLELKLPQQCPDLTILNGFLLHPIFVAKPQCAVKYNKYSFRYPRANPLAPTVLHGNVSKDLEMLELLNHDKNIRFLPTLTTPKCDDDEFNNLCALRPKKDLDSVLTANTDLSEILLSSGNNYINKGPFYVSEIDCDDIRAILSEVGVYNKPPTQNSSFLKSHSPLSVSLFVVTTLIFILSLVFNHLNTFLLQLLQPYLVTSVLLQCIFLDTFIMARAKKLYRHKSKCGYIDIFSWNILSHICHNFNYLHFHWLSLRLVKLAGHFYVAPSILLRIFKRFIINVINETSCKLSSISSKLLNCFPLFISPILLSSLINPIVNYNIPRGYNVLPSTGKLALTRFTYSIRKIVLMVYLVLFSTYSNAFIPTCNALNIHSPDYIHSKSYDAPVEHTNRYVAVFHDDAINQHGPQSEHHISKRYAEYYNLSLITNIGGRHFILEHPDMPQRSPIPHAMENKDFLNDPRIHTITQQQAKKRVKRAFPPDDPYWIFSSFNDPKFTEQWYMHRKPGLDLNTEEAWRLGYTGRGVVVTILDDGIEKDHPELMPNYDPDASYDINGEDSDPQPRYDMTNENRHGTRCAGEVAAVANNSVCIVGVAFNARIGGVRMLDGDVTDEVEARAIGLNPDHVDIYSASWGPDDDGKTLDGPAHLAQQAFENGIIRGRRGLGSIYAWASGNGGRDRDNCNCDGYTNSRYTLSISSATESGHVPWYSEPCSSTLATTYSSGSAMEHKIISTDLRHECTESHTGTSASAPLAAGIIALALEANPNLGWRDMQHLVVATSNPKYLYVDDWIVNGVGRRVSHSFGYGMMDAGAMVKAARIWRNVPLANNCSVIDTRHRGPIPPMASIKLSIETDGCLGKGTRPSSSDYYKYRGHDSNYYRYNSPYSSNGVEENDDSNYIYSYGNHVKYLEHIQARITLEAPERGQIEVYLTSPAGTRSKLLFKRPKDFSRAGITGWPFMTTHSWGELSYGTWTLEIFNGANLPGYLTEWSLIMHGTETQPETLAALSSAARSNDVVKTASYSNSAQGDLSHDSANSGDLPSLFAAQTSLNGQQQPGKEGKLIQDSPEPGSLQNTGGFDESQASLLKFAGNIPNCFKMLYPGHCLVCDDSYALYDGMCLKDCPPNLFKSLIMTPPIVFPNQLSKYRRDISNQSNIRSFRAPEKLKKNKKVQKKVVVKKIFSLVCKSCHRSCKRCKDGGRTHCTDCHDGFYLAPLIGVDRLSGTLSSSLSIKNRKRQAGKPDKSKEEDNELAKYLRDQEDEDIYTGAVCRACHTSCRTCKGAKSTDCTSCPKILPVPPFPMLTVDGRCVSHQHSHGHVRSEYGPQHVYSAGKQLTFPGVAAVGGGINQNGHVVSGYFKENEEDRFNLPPLAPTSNTLTQHFRLVVLVALVVVVFSFMIAFFVVTKNLGLKSTNAIGLARLLAFRATSRPRRRYGNASNGEIPYDDNEDNIENLEFKVRRNNSLYTTATNPNKNGITERLKFNSSINSSTALMSGDCNATFASHTSTSKSNLYRDYAAANDGKTRGREGIFKPNFDNLFKSLRNVVSSSNNSRKKHIDSYDISRTLSDQASRHLSEYQPIPLDPILSEEEEQEDDLFESSRDSQKNNASEDILFVRSKVSKASDTSASRLNNIISPADSDQESTLSSQEFQLDLKSTATTITGSSKLA